jgi:hypothetical protein
MISRPLIILFAAMTVVSFGGPFLIAAVLWGGESSRWPPDRPIEWIVFGFVVSLVVVLFVACVSVRLWYKWQPKS